LKNNIVVILILLGIVFSLTACNSNIDTTDLSSIKIDDIRAGESIFDVNLEGYTKSERFTEKEDTNNFEELRITTNKDGIITQIHANNNDTKLLINDKEGFKDIDDITSVLGENYKNGWYDREQSLKENKYIDYENKLEASFVYDDNGRNLVWIILNIFK
jgi:hypothetical protein